MRAARPTPAKAGVGSLAELVFGVEDLAVAEGPLGGVLAIAVFAVLGYALVGIPLRAARRARSAS